MTFDWTSAALGQLCTLWCAVNPETGGHSFSTREIGARLGCGKNAVIGKAHRLHLPPRPSPLKVQPQSSWTAERDALLTSLRAEIAPGTTQPKYRMRDIAHRLGVSENSARDRAAALKLPPRAQRTVAQPPAPELTPIIGPSLPQMPWVPSHVPTTGAASADPVPPLAREPAPRRPTVEIPDDPQEREIFLDSLPRSDPRSPRWVRPRKSGRLPDGSGCCFPLGEPGKPGFRYCDADLADLRSSFCEEHEAVSFLKSRRAA